MDMDMDQKRIIPAWVVAVAIGVLGSLFVAFAGAGADIGSSATTLAAMLAVLLVPGCIGVAFSAWRSRQKQRFADHAATMAVMETVAPLEAESMPLATVRSLTEVHVARLQHERHKAGRAAKQAS
jgi:hypothetical protein